MPLLLSFVPKRKNEWLCDRCSYGSFMIYRFEDHHLQATLIPEELLELGHPEVARIVLLLAVNPRVADAQEFGQVDLSEQLDFAGLHWFPDRWDERDAEVIHFYSPS